MYTAGSEHCTNPVSSPARSYFRVHGSWWWRHHYLYFIRKQGEKKHQYIITNDTADAADAHHGDALPPRLLPRRTPPPLFRETCSSSTVRGQAASTNVDTCNNNPLPFPHSPPRRPLHTLALPTDGCSRWLAVRGRQQIIYRPHNRRRRLYRGWVVADRCVVRQHACGMRAS